MQYGCVNGDDSKSSCSSLEAKVCSVAVKPGSALVESQACISPNGNEHFIKHKNRVRKPAPTHVATWISKMATKTPLPGCPYDSNKRYRVWKLRKLASK
jgi:hypothetical protein